MMLWFGGVITWMRYLCTQYGYLGIFVMSLAGAVSIVVPVPDTIVVFTLAGLKIGDGWVLRSSAYCFSRGNRRGDWGILGVFARS